MTQIYKDEIARLIQIAPFEIDTTCKLTGRPPTLASSSF